MPEQRARQYHRNRVASTFQEEITAMLEGELTDPRIAASYVSEVVLAPGGKSCRVFIAVHGGAAAEESTLEGLTAARGYIRTEIRDRMGVRHVPEITFAIDRSEKISARMDELLGRMEKRKKKLAGKLERERLAQTEHLGQPEGTQSEQSPVKTVPTQGAH